MILESQIGEAIAFHDDIKGRMRTAIATGKSHLTPERLCRDADCKLGRWLYGLDDSIQATPRWKCVRDLHAEFHCEAAKVLEAALQQPGNVAREMSRYASAYVGVARRFENELHAWKREAAQPAPPDRSVVRPRPAPPASRLG